MLAARRALLSSRTSMLTRAWPAISSTGVLTASEVDLTVGFEPGVTREEATDLIDSVGGTIASIGPDETFYQLAFGPDTDLDAMTARLEASPLVRYVQPKVVGSFDPNPGIGGDESPSPLAPSPWFGPVRLNVEFLDAVDTQEALDLIGLKPFGSERLTSVYPIPEWLPDEDPAPDRTIYRTTYAFGFDTNADLDTIKAIVARLEANPRVRSVEPSRVIPLYLSPFPGDNVTPINPAPGTPGVERHLRLEFQNKVTREQLIAQVGSLDVIVEEFAFYRIDHRLVLGPGSDLESVRARLLEMGPIRYIEGYSLVPLALSS